MHMVSNAANRKGDRFHSLNYTPQVRMQTRTPIVGNQRQTPLRRKNKMEIGRNVA